ncbi:MAG TPA: twin-arginine translocase subunit TatC [Anaerolineae bacterium]|nr:twin-arginine translocase subunit TatC [Anaerolineae bacterium]
MPDIISIIILIFVALLVIGPRRLPQSLEALWLAVTDFQRAQTGQPQLGSLYNARRYWVSQRNNIYAGIQMLYQVTTHLEELRMRLLYILIAFGIGFGLAFTFAQPILAFIIRPIRLIQPSTPTNVPINNYVLAQDVQVQTSVVTATGTVTGTVTIPSGTLLAVKLTNTTPVVLKPTELFSTYIKLALIAGFGVSLPMILLQLLLFLRGPKFKYAALSKNEWDKIRPTLSPEELAEAEQQRADVYEGLTAREVRPMFLLMPFALFLFVGGVIFTYFLLLPNALDFLFGLGGTLVQPLPALEDYIDFALTLIFWVGLTFELPLVMFFLARFNIITARQFARQWRYAVVIIAVAAAVITPTVDVFNMSLVALPMIGLYVLGIVFAWLAHPTARTAPKQIPAQAPSGE